MTAHEHFTGWHAGCWCVRACVSPCLHEQGQQNLQQQVADPLPFQGTDLLGSPLLPKDVKLPFAFCSAETVFLLVTTTARGSKALVASCVKMVGV